MAGRAKKEAAPKAAETETTSLAKWDEELAKQAQIAAGMEANAGGGSFFSLKAGVLSWQEQPLRGNEMAVVILDHVLENVYYEGEYDPENRAPPTCFAFGRDEATMAPHLTVIQASQAQAEKCATCPQNQWGTADKGRGKACRNTRRLAMVSAGEFDKNGQFKLIEDPAHYQTTTVGFMKVPVTSVKGYATFVKQIAGAMKRPPHGVVTRVKVVPDPKSQFKVLFEPLMELPAALLPAIMKRHEETKAVIEFPYPLELEAEAKPAKGKGRGAAKPAAKGKGRGRKY